MGVNKRLLSIPEAAEYIGLAPKTLRNRLGPRAEKPFPVKPKRHGRKLVFEKRDLDSFCDELPYEDYE